MKTHELRIERGEDYEKITRLVDANGGYCPCRVGCTPDTKCMCKEFREQDRPGVCRCGRYRKVKA